MAKKQKVIDVTGDKVAPNSTETYSFELASDAFINEIVLNTRIGQDYDLHYSFMVIPDNGSIQYPIDNIGNQKNYQAGDGALYQFPLTYELLTDDEIKVQVENVDNTETLTVDFSIKITERYK